MLLYKKPEPKFEAGKILDLKGYGRVKILDYGWIEPPITSRPQYIYDFLLNPDTKITKNKRNDFSIYEFEVEMMLSDYETGIDYDKSYEKYVYSGFEKTGRPPLDYVSFIKIINRSLYYKNNPELETNSSIKNFYDTYVVKNDKLKDGGNILSEGDNTNIGVIQEEYGNQFKINGNWYHKSLVKAENKKTDKKSGKFYNGILVPETINPKFVISAFSNPIDENKVKEYTMIMQQEMLSHSFPPITGFPTIIDDSDVGDYFMSGEEITKEHIGKQVWKVWDGHHRVLSAIDVNLPYIKVKLEHSAITNQDELKDGGNLDNSDDISGQLILNPKAKRVVVINNKNDIDKIKFDKGGDISEWLKERPNLAPFITYVDVDLLDNYKEFDRRAYPIKGEHYLDELKAKIKTDGIIYPLALSYGVEDGRLSIGEGNHRLAIAKELGIKQVPVYVKLYRKNGKGKKVAAKRVVAYDTIYDKQGKILHPKEFEMSSNDLILIDGGKIIMVDGGALTVKPFKESLTVINGFYSPIEKRILEFKQDKVTANKWKDIVGVKSDESVYTGLSDYLNSKRPDESLSKSDLIDFLKNNRIEILEVIKNDKKSFLDEVSIKQREDGTYGIVYKDSPDEFVNDEEFETEEELKDYYEIEEIYSDSDVPYKTKYSKYVVKGEASNYTEVLITLPDKEREHRLFYSKLFNELSDKVKSRVAEPDTIKWNTFNIYDYKDKNLLTDSELKELNYIDRLAKIKFSTYSTTHWDERNILVHLRFDTRKDSEGSSVLFINELQSDWGQQGKRKGFKLEKNFISYRTELFNKYKINKVDDLYGKASKDEIDTLDLLFNEGNESIIPLAPFVTDTNKWVKLGLKVAFKYAIINDSKYLSWATGEQENELFDITKEIKRVSWWNVGGSDNGWGITAYKFPTEIVFKKRDVTLQKIEEILGKDVADKIKNHQGYTQAVGQTIYGELDVDALKIGGKGMLDFYGSTEKNNIGIVGNVLKSIVKELTGNKESIIEIGVSGRWILKLDEKELHDYAKKEDADNDLKELSDGKYSDDRISFKQLTNYAVEITSELKDAIKEGVPLFVNGGSVLLAPNGKPSKLNEIQYSLVRTPEFKAWFGDWENDPENSSKVVDSNGEPLVVYHGFMYNHGAGKRFNEFDSLPAFFSTNRRFAEEYASTKSMDLALDADISSYACFLNIKKLFDPDNKDIIEFANKELPEKINVSHGTMWFLNADMSKEEVIDSMQRIITVSPDHMTEDILKSNIGDIIPEKISMSQYQDKILMYKDDEWAYTVDKKSFDECVEFEIAEFILKDNPPTKIKYKGKYHDVVKLNKEKYRYEPNEDPEYLEFLQKIEERKKYYIENILNVLTKDKDRDYFYIIIENPRGYKQTLYVKKRNLKTYKTNTENNWTMFENETVQKFLIDNDFGGWIAYEKGDKTYAVYRANDIKLADGTNTTFDGKNPDIRFDDGGSVNIESINNSCINSLIELIGTYKEIKDWFIFNGNIVVSFENELDTTDAENINNLLIKLTECKNVFEPEILFSKNDFKIINIKLLTDNVTVGEFKNGGEINEEVFEIIPNEQTPNLPKMNDVKSFIKNNLKLLNDFLSFAKTQSSATGLAANQVSINGKRCMYRIIAINKGFGHWELAINPIITEYIGDKETKHEGCLTWKGKDTIVERYPDVKVSYYTIDGKKVTDDMYSGFDAQVWQHETAHLNGVKQNVTENTFFEKGGVMNPYAVCTVSVGGKIGTQERSKWTPAQMNRYEKCVLKVSDKMGLGGGIRTLLYTDENHGQIVFDDGFYKISVNDINDVKYLQLYDGSWKRIGVLEARVKYLEDYHGYSGKFLAIHAVYIDDKHHDKGLGLRMYKLLQTYSADDIIGFLSYLPDRANKKVIPKIYSHFNNSIVEDYHIVTFKNGGIVKQIVYISITDFEGVNCGFYKFDINSESDVNLLEKLSKSATDLDMKINNITKEEYEKNYYFDKISPDEIRDFIKLKNANEVQGSEEHKEGGTIGKHGTKIIFDANKLPNKQVYEFALMVKTKHPEIWLLGGNIFGNQAFKNLDKVIKRGYWMDYEKPMYIKWKSFEARHKHDFRIEGVVANLKWISVVDEGFDYMKKIINQEIKKLNK